VGAKWGKPRVRRIIARIDATFEVLAALSQRGLLLMQDKTLPNVVTLLTGETPRTSWWSHPEAGFVFTVLAELSDHADVLFVKLLSDKVTLVHRCLWPALLAIVSERAPWQLRGLSAPARALLASLDETQKPIVASGTAVKALEVRLLAHTAQVHTDSGRHETVVQPWSAWGRAVKVKPLRSVSFAKQQIEAAVEQLGADRAALPWSLTPLTGTTPRPPRRIR
jgi:hypothetical protein